MIELRLKAKLSHACIERSLDGVVLYWMEANHAPIQLFCRLSVVLRNVERSKEGGRRAIRLVSWKTTYGGPDNAEKI